MTQNERLRRFKDSRAAAVSLLFGSLFSLESVHAAGGLLLFTANGSPYVNAVVYETFSSPTAHLSYLTVKGGSRTQVQSRGIIANLPFPAASNISPNDAAVIIAQTEAYAALYPQHAKLLQGVGELWRRKAEVAKLEQSRAAAATTAEPASQSGQRIVAPGLATVIPLIHTKTGQQFKNARVTRFENDQASVSHADGVTKVSLADISNLSAFPPDVKAAVERVQTDIQTKKEEQERIAKEKAEQERIAKEKADQERLAKEKAEQDRIAKDAEKKEQERLAKIEETKRSDEILVKLAATEQKNNEGNQMPQSDNLTPNNQTNINGSNDKKSRKELEKEKIEAFHIALNTGNLRPKESSARIKHWYGYGFDFGGAMRGIHGPPGSHLIPGSELVSDPAWVDDLIFFMIRQVAPKDISKLGFESCFAGYCDGFLGRPKRFPSQVNPPRFD